jgi:acyl carrier protein
MSISSSTGASRETRGRDTGSQFVVGQDETGGGEQRPRRGNIRRSTGGIELRGLRGGPAPGRGAVFDRTVGFMARERRRRTWSADMIDLIREVIDARGLLPVSARTLAPNANLYDAGFSPFAAIQLTLALEEACGVEFPRRMLRRQSFSSLESIAACLERVERKAA